MIDDIDYLIQKTTTDVIKLGLMYAYNLIEYGVDISEKWDTITQQHAAMQSAYLKGTEDERKRYLRRETR